MLLRYKFWILFLWLNDAGKVTLQSNGSRRLDLQFDNATQMDMLSLKAMKRLHDELDNDDDGNVSISEGVKFLAGHKDLLENSAQNANLPGFATDVDGRITEDEFWNSWIRSDVHNWTNMEMLTWLKYDVELPQYTSNFHTQNVSGAAFPILAYEGSVVSVLVDGSKENKIKLMLKAKEIVLFGPSKQKANFLKDALLTISLLLALSGIFFGVHVQRNANRTIESIEEKMKALQSSMETMEAEGEMDKIWVRDMSRQDDERSGGSNSGESEDSMTSISLTDEGMASTKLAAVMRELDATKEALRNAEKRIERRAYELPTGLLDCLQATYRVESELFEMKKKKVYKDVEQTKIQFQKIERNRSTFLGILQVVHSRQVDSFDFEVQQTRDEFRKLQSIMKERRKRWATIEQLCRCRIKSSSSRNSSTPSKSKLTPEEEIMSSLDSMSVTSTVSNATNVDRSLSLMQRHKGNHKRPSVSPSTDDEDRDTVSLQNFNFHQKKSPAFSKKYGSMPSHTSSPSLSSLSNSEDKKKIVDVKKMTHSESASTLPSHLSIPETGNQTFPKRSPMNKRRSKLPESMLANGNSTASPTTPTSTPTHSKSRPEIVKEVTQSEALSSSKRSTSALSLPLRPTKDLPETNRDVAVEPQVATNGVGETGSDKSSPTPTEKTRKSNMLKRAFFKRKKEGKSKK